MTKLATAVGLALAMGYAGQATSAQYVVIANGNSFDGRLAAAVAQAGGVVTARLPEIGVAIVDAAPGFQARAERIAGVQSVSLDPRTQFLDPIAAQGIEEAANPPTSGDNDRFFDFQWGHDAVDAPEAWAMGHRGAGVRVAVLDSGIDHDHPDIAANLNPALSASFVPGEDWRVRPGVFFSHGTHVAGTIASPDNGIGTIGIAPRAEIVAVKVLSEFTGSGSFGGIIQGLVHAAAVDADVVNMSLGADIPHASWTDEETGEKVHPASLFVATARAVQLAHASGAIVIAAAGNDARDLDHDASLKSFPAELPHVVSVSATAPYAWAIDPSGFLDYPASYTNYGQSGIDLAGPGGDALYPGNENCVIRGVVRRCWIFDLVMSPGSGSWYWSAGTSMAAPHVAGVAALVIGKNGGSMDPDAVLRKLRQGADDLGKPGNDDFYGAGRVNAVGALR